MNITPSNVTSLIPNALNTCSVSTTPASTPSFYLATHQLNLVKKTEEIGTHVLKHIANSPLESKKTPLESIENLFESYLIAQETLQKQLWQNSFGLKTILQSDAFDMASHPHDTIDIQARSDSSEQFILSEGDLLSDRLFQHILGEHFGKRTGLEGYSDSEMLNYLLHMMEKKVESLNCQTKGSNAIASFCQNLSIQKEAFESIVKQFKTAKEINATLRKNFETFSETIKATMFSLKEGESFFFQGGWAGKGKTPGHSMVYELIKEKADFFTLRVYNRGAGVEKYHTQSILKGKEHHLPFTEIIHIPFRRFTKMSILKALWELENPPETREWKPDDFYQLILPLLGGQMSSHRYSVDQLMESLNVGHCTYLSLTSLIHEHLKSTQYYQRWEFELQFSTLWNYYRSKSKKDAFHNDERSYRLLKKGLEQFVRNARQSYSNGIITLDEWELATKTVEEIQHHLRTAEQSHLQKAALKARPPFTLENQGSTEWQDSLAELFKAPANKDSSQYTLDVRPYRLRPETMISKLEEFHERFEKAIVSPYADKGTFIALKEAIEDLVLNFSLDSFQKSLSKFSPSSAKKAILEIEKIAKDYLWSTLHAVHFDREKEARVRPAEYLTILKLFTLAEALNHQCASNNTPSICADLPDLYQWDMGHLLEGRSGEIHFFDPVLEDNLHHLRAYWKNKAKPRKEDGFLSFFGVEKLPASSAINSKGENAERFRHDDDRLSYGWSSEIAWKDLDWAKGWISNNEISKKIKGFSPALAKEGLFTQALYFFHNQTKDWSKEGVWPDKKRPEIFPSTLYPLRDLSFAMDFLLKNNWDVSQKPELTAEQTIPPFISKATLHSGGAIRMDGVRPFSLQKNDKNEEKERKTSHGLAKIQLKDQPYHLNANDFLKRTQTALKELVNPFYLERKSLIAPIHTYIDDISFATFRRRHDPHFQRQMMPLNVNVTNKLGVQESRELLALSGIPSHQVQETFAYFQRYPLLLVDHRYQEFFRKLMFEPPLLIEKLLSDPKEAQRFSKQFADFCAKGYGFYKEYQDIPTAAFYLEVGHYFSNTLDYLSTADSYRQLFQSYPLPLSEFPKAKVQFKNLLTLPDLSPKVRTLLSLNLLQVFRNAKTLDEKDVADFLSSAIWVKKSAPNPNEEDLLFSKTQYFATRDLPYRFAATIKTALESNHRDAILNAVASSFLNKKCEWTWKSYGATFINSEGTITIDPFEAVLLESGSAAQALLPLSDKITKQIYNTTKIAAAREVQPGVFESQNEKGIRYRIANTESGKIAVIYREVNGKWHQKLQNHQISLPLILTAHDFWLEADRSQSVSEALFGYNRKLWITNKDTGQLLYEAEVKETGSTDQGDHRKMSYQPITVYQLDAAGKRTGLVLANTRNEDSFLDSIKQFEEGAYILAWVDPVKGVPEQIQLPRFGLNFVVRNGKADCLSLEGYSIASDQYVPDLGQLTHYLVLEKENKKIILFPRQHLKEPKQGTLIVDPAPYRSDDFKPIPYYTFDLTKEGKVNPNRTEEGRLYLAMLRLAEQKYDEALETLSGIGSQIKEYRKEEAEVLMWTLQLAGQTKDADPKAIALRLKAGFLLLKNKEDFGKGLKQTQMKEEKVLFDELVTVCQLATQKRDQIPERFRLALHEEKFLLDKLNEYEQLKGLLEERKAQLEGTSLHKQSNVALLGIKGNNLKGSNLYNRVNLFNFYASWDSPTNNNFLFFLDWLSFSNTNNPSLLQAKELSNGFLETYETISLLKTIKKYTQDEEILRPYYEKLYLKVLNMNPPESFSIANLEEELFAALELIIRGYSDDSERAAATIMAALMAIPDVPAPVEEITKMIRETKLIELTNIFRPLVGGYLSFLYQKNLEPVPPGITVAPFSPSNAKTPLWNSYEDYNQCLNAPFFHESDIPAVGPAHLVNQIAPLENEKKKIEDLTAELKMVFDLPIHNLKNATIDQSIIVEMEGLKKKIDGFALSNKGVPFTYEINTEHFNIIQKSIGMQMETLERDVDLIKNEMLQIATKDPACIVTSEHSPFWNSLQEQMRHSSGVASAEKTEITLNALIYMYISREMDRLGRWNRALSKEEIQRVYELTGKFLIHSTSLQHLRRLSIYAEKTKSIHRSYKRVLNEISSLEWLRGSLNRRKEDFDKIEGIMSGLIPFGSGNRANLKEGIYTLYDKCQIPRPDLERSDLLNTLLKELTQSFEMKEKEALALSNELKIYQEGLAKLERTHREYATEDYPEYLVFEYFTDQLLRKEQVDNIASIDQSSANEMIMGSGKTSILLPLIALRNTNQGSVSVLVMPDALVGSIAETLRKQFKEGFNLPIEVFAFKRERRLDLSELKRIKQRLVVAKEEKKSIVMSGESFQTFFLSFIERFLEFSEKKFVGPLGEEVDAFRDILFHFGNSGDLILDELDSLLNVLKAHHFTWGPSSPLSKDVVDTIADLYELLSKDVELSGKIKWGFLPSATGGPFTALNYGQLRPLLIQKILEGKVRSKILGPFLADATVQQKQWIQEYLAGSKIIKKEKGVFDHFVDSFPWIASIFGFSRDPAFDYVKSCPGPVRTSFAILKEELNKIMPLTAKKQIDEHYGAIPEKRENLGNSKLMAIPYHGSSNPLVGSQFGNDLEIINYTVQLHLAKGIGLDLIQKKLDELRNKFLEESVSKEHSVAFRAFLGLGGTKSMNLLNLSDADKVKIATHINANPKLQLDFIREYILPDLKTYPQQLKANAHLFPLLIKKIKGFSGTLWNYRSYPKAFTRFSFSDTEAKTLLLLWKDSPHQITNLNETSTIKEMLKQIYSDFDGSFIDLGGIFRGLNNRQIAREILATVSSKKPSIKGVIFYDENDEKRVMLADGKAMTIAESGLSDEQLIAFWGQKHTTGAHVDVSPTMKATISAGRHTMMRDLLQGAWRLRGLDKGQRIRFAILREDREAIAETLNELGVAANPDDLDLDNLFLHSKYIEILRQGDDNFRSLRQKLEAVLMEPVIEMLLNPTTTHSEFHDLVPLVKELFTLQKPEDAFELYGAPEEFLPAEEAVSEEKKRSLNSLTMTLLRGNSFFHDKVDVKKIEERLNQIAEEEKAYIPQQVQQRKNTQTETEVQLESQLNVNTEISIKTEYAPTDNLEHHPVILWPMKDHLDPQFFKPSSCYYWDSVSPASVKLPQTLSAVKELIPNTNSLLQLQGAAPILRVNEVLSRHDIAILFDPNLLSTLNCMPVQFSKNSPLYYQPFDKHQGVDRKALIVRNPKTGSMQYILLDAWDALQWENYLQRDRMTPPTTPHDCELCLYHWDLGIYAEGAQPFPEGALKNKESHFHALNAQAKFFAGEVKNYSKEELAFLESWMQKRDARWIYTVFYTQILEWKEKNRKMLPKSPLGELFQKLNAVPQEAA